MKVSLLSFLITAFVAVIFANAGDSAAGSLPRSNKESPTVIKKIQVSDCRVVRGFFGAPVDGSVKSRNYSGGNGEYPSRSSDGVQYSFNRNDGVHITLADKEGFDFVVLRSGARTKMYSDSNSLLEPQTQKPLYVFNGNSPVQIASFSKRVVSQRVSFFGTEKGFLSEVSFYRIEKSPPKYDSIKTFYPADKITLTPPASPYSPENLYAGMTERYGENERSALRLTINANEARPLNLNQYALHLITPPEEREIGLTAIAIAGTLTGTTNATTLTFAVQDPLNPRRDIFWIDTIVQPGRFNVILDIPDQVLLTNSQLWLTLRADKNVTVTGNATSAPEIIIYLVQPQQALPEALAWRKFLLKSLFSVLSEPRPWGGYRQQSREEFFASSPYAGQCPELFMTIDQCHQLAPQDNTIRQYREWVYRRNLPRLSAVAPPPPPPDSVPQWAWYPRLAWLETRRIASWWLDNRLVETGEIGGAVGDDTDWFQQFIDLPFFEDGDIAERLRDAAARLAELADKQNLRSGININYTDALHAYEEGINHLALMARWFYGDPIYIERCFDSARNIEKLTVKTQDGRRMFRNADRMGARDLDKPSTPTVDGHATPLMWHAALQAAEYNRNPQALKLIREWAETWLNYMKPGQWATSVEVLSGKILRSEKDNPLYGGYSSQATVFTWLYSLTGDTRYIEPFLYYARRARAPHPASSFLVDLFTLNALSGLDQKTIESLAEFTPALPLYLRGDPALLIKQTIGNPSQRDSEISCLYDALRFPDIYTSAEVFTDRVFPHILQNASIAYLGGYTRRNKFNPTQAVSWEGFGTNYAALVLANQPNKFKALLYSYAQKPMTGRVRFWALEHGRYRISIGIDANNDQQIDKPSFTATREIIRADTQELTLTPRIITVIEANQIEKLQPIWQRANLAIAKREIKITGNTISGVVHNIGSADVNDVQIAVVNANGKIIARKSLGKLPAPIDLIPKRTPFELQLPQSPQKGFTLIVDPDNTIPEIYEGNNSIQL